MAVQNLVSASITAATKTKILASIADIRSQLDFLLTLQKAERMSLFKAGKELGPFLDVCHSVTKSHPEILSGVFDGAEFDRDYQLSKDLADICDSLTELQQGVSDTLTAARSDTLITALDVYSAVKFNRNKVAGLGSVADNLGRYFKKTQKASTTNK